LFKGLKDVNLTLTLNESEFIKFTIIHEQKLGVAEFAIENDFIHRKQLGDLKALMVSNKMDYEEQVKREEDQKKENEMALKEHNGVFEIGDSGDEEIQNGNQNGKKSMLKRNRVEDEIEMFDEKPSKQIKID